MKPKHVHTKAELEGQRKHGDAPDLGRVARIPGERVAQKKFRRRRSSGSASSGSRSSGNGGSGWAGRQRQRRMQARIFAFRLWLALMIFICFGAFAGGMILWLRSQDDREASAPGFEPLVSEPQWEFTDFTPPSEIEAVRIVENAIAARDVEMLREFVHETHEADAEAMLAFFSEMGGRDGQVVRYNWIGAVDDDAHTQIQSIHVITEKDYLRSTRAAMLVPDASGTWRLDFPSFARWCDPPIQMLGHEEGYPGGRVRVITGRDFYFNGPFSDDREWVCFSFASPDSETTGFAYTRIGSQEHIQMQSMLQASKTGATRATLEIRRVEGANPNQFELSRILNDTWLAIDFLEDDGEP